MDDVVSIQRPFPEKRFLTSALKHASFFERNRFFPATPLWTKEFSLADPTEIKVLLAGKISDHPSQNPSSFLILGTLGSIFKICRKKKKKS